MSFTINSFNVESGIINYTTTTTMNAVQTVVRDSSDASSGDGSAILFSDGTSSGTFEVQHLNYGTIVVVMPLKAFNNGELIGTYDGEDGWVPVAPVAPVAFVLTSAQIVGYANGKNTVNLVGTVPAEAVNNEVVLQIVDPDPNSFLGYIIIGNFVPVTTSLSGTYTLNDQMTSPQTQLAVGESVRIGAPGFVASELIVLTANSATAPAAGSSGTANTPVTINLAVEISASGDISIFGTPEVQVSNIIVATQTLPVAALYDASNASGASVVTGQPNSMFEFWEPSTDRGTRAATLSGKDASPASGGRSFKKLTRKLIMDIQAVLEASFNVTTASPFNLAKYDNVPEYRTVANFGELALRTFAHYLLGHIDSASAITNDVSFVRAMLSQDGDGVYKRATVYNSYADYVPSGLQGSNVDAKLAELLVQAIVNKNDTAILAIAEQVLGQDVSRAMDQDNNIAAPNVRQALKFIPNDVIYMNIKLLKPDVTMGLGQKVSDVTVENKYATEENYTLKITLA